ncbi:hypothetical protein D4764_17G0007420 [Takifugu flavidus]|uniref:Uncharacterized protein n=1 Tax=Takifugu flavidus TaxID=433684 RepID=A0A5C6NX83_9TELE|nr:hypothetical protein D4764_17G0007420 [Takifugu flavidus]
MAAQERALSTRAIEARVYHTRQDPRCRLGGDAPETVQHITAGCKMLAGKAYMERHNQVAGIVYRNICTEYGLEVPGSRWETPPKMLENKQAKILWDFQTQTDKMVVANQPDIVVVDKRINTGRQWCRTEKDKENTVFGWAGAEEAAGLHCEDRPTTGALRRRQEESSAAMLMSLLRSITVGKRTDQI